MRRPLYARTTGKRSGRRRLAAGLVRVTKRGRRLTDQERAEVVKQMHREGRLGREVR
jgi:hypothetical protein